MTANNKTQEEDTKNNTPPPPTSRGDVVCPFLWKEPWAISEAITHCQYSNYDDALAIAKKAAPVVLRRFGLRLVDDGDKIRSELVIGNVPCGERPLFIEAHPCPGYIAGVAVLVIAGEVTDAALSIAQMACIHPQQIPVVVAGIAEEVVIACNGKQFDLRRDGPVDPIQIRDEDIPHLISWKKKQVMYEIRVTLDWPLDPCCSNPYGHHSMHPASDFDRFRFVDKDGEDWTATPLGDGEKRLVLLHRKKTRADGSFVWSICDKHEGGCADGDENCDETLGTVLIPEAFNGRLKPGCLIIGRDTEEVRRYVFIRYDGFWIVRRSRNDRHGVYAMNEGDSMQLRARGIENEQAFSAPTGPSRRPRPSHAV